MAEMPHIGSQSQDLVPALLSETTFHYSASDIPRNQSLRMIDLEVKSGEANALRESIRRPVHVYMNSLSRYWLLCIKGLFEI